MSKKNHKKKKSGKLTLVLGIVALVLAFATVGLLIAARGMEAPADTQPNRETVPGETEVKIEPTEDSTEHPDTPADPTSAQETEGSDGQPEETKGNSGSDKDNNTDGKDNNGKDNNSGGNTDKKPEETKPNTDEPQPPAEIVARADADYERWLAAAMVMGISMEYPDFELTGIYIASETTIENKSDSAGAYVLFTSGGKAMAVHSLPLTGERNAAGTIDLSTETLGFATFDSVDPKSVDTGAMKKLTIEDLGELIAQSLLVSVYIH